MKAVLLAGGEGTRLRQISGGLPKPMMPLLGKPLLERIIALLRENGFDELCLTLRYRPEAVRSHFGDGSRFGVRIEYREETAPLGTAGAVKNCLDFLKNEPEYKVQFVEVLPYGQWVETYQKHIQEEYS